ncbi:MAG: hypothetical protein Q7S21_03325 [archaeon]|nr:hypothetical protein [archaeon]
MPKKKTGKASIIQLPKRPKTQILAKPEISKKRISKLKKNFAEKYELWKTLAPEKMSGIMNAGAAYASALGKTKMFLQKSEVEEILANVCMAAFREIKIIPKKEFVKNAARIWFERAAESATLAGERKKAATLRQKTRFLAQ